jgi:hypothetical protein
MPQLSSYPAITELAIADVLLVWSDAESAVKTISVENAVSELKRFMDTSLTIDEFATNATLATERLVVSNSGAGVTLTLPEADERLGERIYIANRGTNLLTLEPDTGETINGLAELDLSPNEGVVIISLGNGLWQTFGTA